MPAVVPDTVRPPLVNQKTESQRSCSTRDQPLTSTDSKLNVISLYSENVSNFKKRFNYQMKRDR